MVVVQESGNEWASRHARALNEDWRQIACRAVASCRSKKSRGRTGNSRCRKALKDARNNEEINIAGRLEQGECGGGADKAS